MCAAFMFFAAVLSLALRFLLVWENRRLDERYGVLSGVGVGKGKGGQEEVVATPDEKEGESAVEDYGPRFRYVL